MKINNDFSIIESQDPQVLHNKAESMKNKDDEALMNACKEFEAIFIQMMFKEMYKTIPDNGLIERSNGTKIFEEMYIEEISKEITKKDSGFGIAEMMYEQFKKGYISW